MRMELLQLLRRLVKPRRHLINAGQVILSFTPEAVLPEPEVAAAHVPVHDRKQARASEAMQKRLPSFGTIVEFFGAENSNMGNVSKTVGLNHTRLTKSFGNISKPEDVKQLKPSNRRRRTRWRRSVGRFALRSLVEVAVSQLKKGWERGSSKFWK